MIFFSQAFYFPFFCILCTLYLKLFSISILNMLNTDSQDYSGLSINGPIYIYVLIISGPLVTHNFFFIL